MYSAMFASRRPAALKFKRKIPPTFEGIDSSWTLGVDFEKAKLRLPQGKPCLLCSFAMHHVSSTTSAPRQTSILYVTPKKESTHSRSFVVHTADPERGCVPSSMHGLPGTSPPQQAGQNASHWAGTGRHLYKPGKQSFYSIITYHHSIIIRIRIYNKYYIQLASLLSGHTADMVGSSFVYIYL